MGTEGEGGTGRPARGTRVGAAVGRVRTAAMTSCLTNMYSATMIRFHALDVSNRMLLDAIASISARTESSHSVSIQIEIPSRPAAHPRT